MKIVWLMVLSIFFIFLSCFSDYKGKCRELFTVTNNLRVRCRNKKLLNSMVYDADSLHSIAKSLFEKNEYGKCYKTLDKAYVYYTYSIAYDKYIHSQRRIDTLNKSIEKINEEYSSYEKFDRN